MSSGTVFGGQIARLRKRPDVDVDALDGSEFTTPALVDDVPVVFQDALAAAGDDAGVAAGGVDHERSFAKRSRFRLLAIHVFAVPAGFDDHDRVPVIRRGDVHRVDVVAGEQFAKVVVGRAVGVAVFPIDLLLGGFADAAANIAHGDILHVAATEKGSLVAASHVADADPAHHDPIAGRWTRIIAQGARSNDVGDGEGRGGGLDDLASSGLMRLVHESMRLELSEQDTGQPEVTS